MTPDTPPGPANSTPGVPAKAGPRVSACLIVRDAAGEHPLRVNQRLAPKNGPGLSLGVFDFAAGEQGWVEVRNDDADGFVVADAVQFVPRAN